MTEMGKSLQKYLAVLEKYVTLQPKCKLAFRNPKSPAVRMKFLTAGLFS